MAVYSQSNDAENAYFNVTINGPPAAGTVDSIPAVFDITRTQPILAKPNEYYASIIRLSIPLNSMPVFICPIKTLPNTTPWNIGIYFNGNYYSQDLMWQTELFTPQGSNPINWHFFAFSFFTFVSMVNVAMAAAYAAFKAANPAAPQAVANQAPFLIFNPTTELFSWVWHNSWASNPPAVDPPAMGVARVGLNYALLSVFDGFRKLLVGSTPPSATHPDPNDQAEYVWEITGDNAYTLNGFTNTSFTSQDLRTDNLLSNLRRLVVTTSSLPIVPEAVPSTTFTGGASTDAGTSSSLPILTDFVPQLDFAADLRGTVYYQPQAQYRLTNLISDLPLYRVQLSFFWQANDGTLFPILISRNQQIEAKLGFFKKSLYGRLNMPQLR